jgi:hypothetical protein
MMMFLASFLRDHAPANSALQFKPNVLSIKGSNDSIAIPTASYANESIQNAIPEHQFILQELLKAGKKEQTPNTKKRKPSEEIDFSTSPIPIKSNVRSSNILEDALNTDSLISGFSPIPKLPLDPSFNLENQSPDPIVSSWLPSPGKENPNAAELFTDPVKELGLEVDEDPLDLNEFII